MILKKSIRKILEEHVLKLCYDKYGNFLSKSEYGIDGVEIDEVVKLIMKAINDRPLMETLK